MRRGEYKFRILEMHLKLRDQQLKTILYIYIPKPHGNHKTKIYNRYTHTKEKAIQNTTLKIVIKSEENKRQREEKRPTKTNPNQLKSWQ